MIRVAHPDDRPPLQGYYDRALTVCGPANAQTPQILAEAYDRHIRARDTGRMLP